jgi:acyl carrier protein
MADKAEILEDVKKIVHEEADVPEDKITPEADLTDDLDVDSLAKMSIVVAIEEKFDVKISDDDLAKVKTVGDAVNYIHENAKA